MKKELTIVVPTYNRHEKLDRLLKLLVEMIRGEQLSNQVSILVSDNASGDKTSEVVRKYMASCEFLAYSCNETNLGFDGNVFRAYSIADSEYVWFFSDDDLPDEDSLNLIIKTLRHFKPSLLRFSFRQPSTCTRGAFNFDVPVHTTSQEKECIDYTLRYPKISTYIIKKVEFPIQTRDYLRSTDGDGYSFLMISLSLLQHIKNATVAVISKTLASCDDDFAHLSYSPEPFLNWGKQANHPYILKYSPEQRRRLDETGYLTAISIAYQVLNGKLTTSVPGKYKSFVNNLTFRPVLLLRNPRYLIKFVLIKQCFSRFQR